MCNMCTGVNDICGMLTYDWHANQCYVGYSIIGKTYYDTVIHFTSGFD